MWFQVVTSFLFFSALSGHPPLDFAPIPESNLRHNLQIHGGHPVNITDAPFMARLYYDGDSYCGASIIHKRFVLSARHCSISLSPFTVQGQVKDKVIVGSDNRHDTKYSYDIQALFRNPKADVMVIQLKKELTFNDRVQPIKLADQNLVLQDGEVLETMGFGRTQNGLDSKVLLKVAVKFVNNEKCREVMPDLTTTEICAGGEEGKDSCRGDSGGPLTYKNILVGIVTRGNECGIPGYPGIYESVAKSRKFIDEVIQANQ